MDEMDIDNLIRRAVDRQDGKAAGQASEALRARRWNYARVFARVSALRPACTMAEWDALLQESDD